jgi:hypothetical protein
MTSSVRRTLQHAAVALAALALAACDQDLGPIPGQPNGDARVRFVNAAQGTGAVTLRWNGEDVFSAVDFGAVGAAGQYADVAAGTRQISFRKVPSNDVLTNGNIVTAVDRDYTVALIRRTAGYDAAVLSDTNATAAGKASLRIAHLAFDVLNLDVYVTAPGASIEDAEPTFAHLGYGLASGYLPLDPGTYQVRVTRALSPTVLLDVGTLTLAAGQVRTVLVLDPSASGGAVRAVTLADRN